MIEKKNILGVGITNSTKEEILEYIIKSLENFEKKLFFVTPNPEFLVLANKNPAFKNILNRADLALNDGIGVLIAGKILGKKLKQRFTGVELLENLCLMLAEKPITVGFLGGRPGVAEKTAECLQKKYPGLRISFVGEEWPEDNMDDRRLKVEDRNSSTFYHLPSSIDILFVAFGAPKQEMWISENLDKIPVKIAIGVGGAFDYISGRVERAPLWVQKIGLEWLYRLIREPWRIQRQLSLLEFAWLVFKEKLKEN